MKIKQDDIVIREFIESDIEQIHALEEDIFPHPWTLEMFQDDFNQKDNFTKTVKGKTLNCRNNYVLEYRGEVIAFYMGWAIFDEYTILNIGVKADFQEQGLGSLLMMNLVNKAIELECSYIYLEVRASNIPAQRLYEKFQFEEIGRRKDYYMKPKEDAIVMKLDTNML